MRRGASGFMRAFSRLPRLTREIATGGRARGRGRGRAIAQRPQATDFLNQTRGLSISSPLIVDGGKERDSISVNELHRAEKLGKNGKNVKMQKQK